MLDWDPSMGNFPYVLTFESYCLSWHVHKHQSLRYRLRMVAHGIKMGLNWFIWIYYFDCSRFCYMRQTMVLNDRVAVMVYA